MSVAHHDTHPDYIPATETLLRHAADERDMLPHITTLQRLARGCKYVVEFGVRRGASTWALLDAIAEDGRLDSWDIAPQMAPDRVRFDPRWTLIGGDSLTAVPRETPCLVFIDTSHRYAQTLAELRLSGSWGTPTIVLHDWNIPDVRRAIVAFLDESPDYRWGGEEQSEWGMAWLFRS